MKKLLLLAAFVFLCRFLFAQAPTGKLVVEVQNLRNANGSVLLSVFKGGSGFPGKAEAAVYRAKASISGSKAVATFANVPHGEYAVAIMHDEDNNGKLNTNMLGIPKEGYAASNNAKGSLGPPKYDDARFRLEAPELKLEIRMTY
jgi:uncharacterized protein (DUF2141 family)